MLPPVFFDLTLLDVQLWQWVGLMLLTVLVWLLSWWASILMLRLLRPLIARSHTKADDRFVDAAAAPMRLILALGLFASGSRPFGLEPPVQAVINESCRILTILTMSWLIARIVDGVTSVVSDRLTIRGQASAAALMPLGRRAVKAAVFALALLAVLQHLGFNVTAMLAGLGVGGLALALAAQKTVENLFGGLTLIADQPVRVGDFCRFGDQVGTIEDIGLRSTRVRTNARTLVSIPNGEFATMQLENYTERDRIWFHTTLGLRYETSADQLRHVLIELKKLLAAHPQVDPNPARVRFVQFGASSLDLEIFAYVRTRDMNEYLAVQEHLLLRIMDIVAASGTGFAYPSQTLYMAGDTGLDAQRRAAAEQQVQRWRDENALALPTFPTKQLAELRGTLDYPARGAAVGA